MYIGAKHLVKNISTQKSFGRSQSKAVQAGFLKTDKRFLDLVEAGGSTAILAVLTGPVLNPANHPNETEGHLLVANAGDSRAVASVSGQAVALSVDHKVLSSFF